MVGRTSRCRQGKKKKARTEGGGDAKLKPGGLPVDHAIPATDGLETCRRFRIGPGLGFGA